MVSPDNLPVAVAQADKRLENRASAHVCVDKGKINLTGSNGFAVFST